MTQLRVATRGSPLARWQAEHVATLLRAADRELDVELVPVETTGDRRLDAPIWELGGKGVFAKEVQAAVLDGRADLAVHSAKDLPSQTIEGLVLAAVPERGDPRDALVGSTLADLRPGATVGTGSVRRRAQLADLRPDLTFTGVRGNMATRVARANELGAVVVALVALQRLGLDDQIAEVFEPTRLVPQVAQGALGVECRRGDRGVRERLAAIEHAPSRRVVDAERAFLTELGGSCDLPAGAHARLEADDSLRVDAVLASLDGRVVLRHTARGDEPIVTGIATARWLLDHGGAGLLAG